MNQVLTLKVRAFFNLYKREQIVWFVFVCGTVQIFRNHDGNNHKFMIMGKINEKQLKIEENMVKFNKINR